MKSILLGIIANNSYNEVSTPILSFIEVHNSGAAFSILTEKTNMLIISAVVCIIILCAVVFVKTSKLTHLMILSMSMLVSGMVINTVERIHDGYVTDYMYFTFLKNFPVFNFPDVMIVVGAIILAVSLVNREK